MSVLDESLSRLYRLQAFGIKLGLETVRAMMESLGHPEQTLPFIHVAGTNGKGSVCAMMESVLRAAGLRTGLYTSPHLVRFNERIRIMGRSVDDDELAGLIPEIERHAKKIESLPGGRPITFFEFVTALAFECFRRHNLDLVVLETGMGGRLDATNVVDPLVSVITGISLEHAEYLGNDLAAIAAEKGGIIKPGRPVVIGPVNDETLGVLEAIARERHSRMIRADGLVSVRRQSEDWHGQRIRIESEETSYGTVRLPLVGSHQLENCAVAVAALESLPEPVRSRITPEHVKTGLEQVAWPGRIQVISEDPVMIVDGAHNPEAAECLADSLKKLLKKKPLGLVLGMCSDKDFKGYVKAFSGLVKRCWVVPLNNERSRNPSTIGHYARSMGWAVTESTLPAAIEEARGWAKETGGVVCFTGSLFLAGEVLGRIGA